MIRRFSSLKPSSRSWLVIGGGPCGIGVTGKLLDLEQHVTWIDPAFEVGRMGPFYRNVPANTLNGDLIKAFNSCASFEFDRTQRERKSKGMVVMSDLDIDRCHSLSTFVDALDDTTMVLKNKVHRMAHGKVESIKLMDNDKWHCWVQTGGVRQVHEDIDAVVLVGGCLPRSLLPFPSVQCNEQPKPKVVECNESKRTKVVQFHSLDLMVDPPFCRGLADKCATTDRWGVIGNSHSGMLVIKNLIDAGFTNVLNFHRSPLKFMYTNERGVVKYPGTGLKGPVGEWVKWHSLSKTSNDLLFQSIRQSDGNSSWESFLVKHDIDHCVVAIGFDREDSVKIETFDGKEVRQFDLDRYDGISGEIKIENRSLRLFGTGIAFPKFHYDGENELDPWVGFRKSIEQTELMVSVAQK